VLFPRALPAHTPCAMASAVPAPKLETATMTVTKECLDEFKALKTRRRYRWLLLVASSKDLTVSLEQAGPRDSSPEDFMKALPRTACRYAIYDFDYVRADGRPGSKLFLMLWAPNTAQPHDRMFYTSQKAKVTPSFTGIESMVAHSLEDVEMAVGGHAGGARDTGTASSKAKVISVVSAGGTAPVKTVGAGDDDEDDPFADEEDFE
jgi:cofilin